MSQHERRTESQPRLILIPADYVVPVLHELLENWPALDDPALGDPDERRQLLRVLEWFDASPDALIEFIAVVYWPRAN